MTIGLAENGSAGETATQDCECPELSRDFYLHFEKPTPLSHRGKQKQVYRAIWKPIQREVIVKYHKDENRTALTELEMVAHPLSLSHPNVVETYVVGSAPQVFLVEREVTPLHNGWVLHGMDEAVTLLCHIARALSFLQRKSYIHADIKPENLGLDRERFILMDFGVCKKLDKFDPARDEAGTVRTRAPEVLAKSSPRSHQSDLWSLGASMFRLFTQRFPLVLDGEEVPLDKEDHAASDRVREMIRQRAKDENLWRTDFWRHDCWSKVPPRLEPLIRKMLARDPGERIDSEGVVRYCEEEFAPYLLEDLPAAPVMLASQKEMLSVLRALRAGKAGVGFKPNLRNLPLLTRQRHAQWLSELLLLNHLSADNRTFIQQQLQELKEGQQP